MVKHIIKKMQQDTRYKGNNLLAHRKLGKSIQKFRERLILQQNAVNKQESKEPKVVGY